eukprot:2894344-Pyramimonas_sp.AAC.1
MSVWIRATYAGRTKCSFEPHMSEATCRSGERIHVALSSAWGVPYGMGGDAGIGRARCGVRATLYPSWKDPLFPGRIMASVSRSTVPWIA